jgi:mannose-6-phosphate isomerase-like protein (cupin superfamily)
MKITKLSSMTNGWFIGDFEPTLFKTKDFEVAIQHFDAGEKAGWHVHKLATEYTVIVSGRAEMNGRALEAGDIVVLEPGEGSDFNALTDVVTAVVKTPSVKGDKHGPEGLV